MSRFRILAGVTSIGLLGSASVRAQIAPPAAPMPMAPGAQAMAGATTATTTGSIRQLLTNPNGDLDGFLLDDGTQVNFPPHLSTALGQIASVGDRVDVQGFRGSATAPLHATLITNTATGQSVADQPPAPGTAPPASPPALAALSSKGSVTQLLYTDRGDLNGAVVSDGTVVRFPPHIGAQLQAALRPGAELVASGYGAPNRYGRALEATLIGVNGQAPLAVFGPAPR